MALLLIILFVTGLGWFVFALFQLGKTLSDFLGLWLDIQNLKMEEARYAREEARRNAEYPPRPHINDPELEKEVEKILDRILGVDRDNPAAPGSRHQ